MITQLFKFDVVQNRYAGRILAQALTGVPEFRCGKLRHEANVSQPSVETVAGRPSQTHCQEGAYQFTLLQWLKN